MYIRLGLLIMSMHTLPFYCLVAAGGFLGDPMFDSLPFLERTWLDSANVRHRRLASEADSGFAPILFLPAL